MILGEMVNLQKVNWPKSQLAKKSQLTKNTNHSILVILSSGWRFWQVGFLVSWLFGGWLFLLVLNCTAYMHSTEHTDICDIDNGERNDDIMGMFEEVKM